MGLVVKVSHQLAAGWCVAAAPTYTQLLIFCRKISVTKVREREAASDKYRVDSPLLLPGFSAEAGFG